MALNLKIGKRKLEIKQAIFTYFALSMILSTSAARLRSKHFEEDFHDPNENEVIKGVTLPKVPADALEAYYYDLYEDFFEVQGYFGRPGNSTETNSCADIRDVPRELREPVNLMPVGADSYYQKYTEAYGIPVLGSASVSDTALGRACYVLRFLLADRADLRQSFYKTHGRLVVIGRHELIADIPEYSFLPPEFNEATRGLGALPVVPVTSGAEENILCEEQDLYISEDILLRQIAVGILRVAADHARPQLYDQLRQIYHFAMRSGWWTNTYAARTVDSYFGEGVQSFFNVNGFSPYPDGRHNDISTRPKLRQYDVSLSNLIQTMFPCGNRYIHRCNSRGHEPFQVLDMNCGVPIWQRRSRRARRR